MKKIGIITLFGYDNYGNRLQMYSSQEIYKKIGFETKIIKYSYSRNLKGKVRGMIRKIINNLFYCSKEKLKNDKIRRFKENSKKNIKESKKKIFSNKLPKYFHNDYDYFSVGSDQIWSSRSNVSKCKNFIFLKFAPKEKRIALSPSFGKSSIPAESEEEIKEGLLGFEHLSVREDAGAKIIKDLTGRDAEVLVDPTMILSKNEWIEFSEQHKLKPSKKYILTYFLGPLPDKVKDIIKANKEYEVIQLCSFDMPEYYDTNPSEWVDFVKDAALFLTDSFHGVVFAHILKTPFIVYDRIGGKSMGSRITTILKKFNMEDRHELTKDSTNLFNVDFSNVDSIIEKEKQKTMNYLKKVLKNNDYEK